MVRKEDLIRTRVYKRYCLFCKEKKEPDYKDIETLKRLITERGKIISRARTGVCSSHQSKLATAIKRARNLALLPFKPSV